VAEDAKAKLDRELIELLNELRVVLPGVQVMFAFLLTVPFSNRFNQISTLQRNAYFAAFLFTTVASILLITPSAYHRLRWRQRDKEHILTFSNRVAIAGGIAGAAVLVFWFLIPLLRAAEEE
jgi:predicted neutral ceramidase superfamily lipid hydrolase